MISWIVVAALILIGVFAIKATHFKRRFLIILFVVLALFFYATFYIVSSKNDLDFSSFEGVVTASKVYMGWLANGFNNMKAITGNAVKLDWTSTNASFFGKSKVTTKNSRDVKSPVKK